MNFQPYVLLFTHKLLPFALAVIGFGLLISVHELGHFVFCKLFGVHTPSFSIGFGPSLIEKKIGDTKFKLAAIPLGGYVEIAGQAEVGQGKQLHAKDTSERSFMSKAYWQKAFIILGGVIFNILFAYLIFSVLFMVGIPKQKGELVVSSVLEGSAAAKYDLKSKDKIVAINNKQISSEPDKMLLEMQTLLSKEIAENPFKQITLSVIRNDEKKDLKVTLGGKDVDGKTIGSLGVYFEPQLTPIEGEYQKFSIPQAIIKGVNATHNVIFQIIYGLKTLIQQRSFKGAGGPIMIISKSFESAQRGLISLFIFLAIISVNLAIINILPLGALDGGQLLFVSIEAIIRRQIPEIIKIAINLTSWILLIWLIIYLSFRDILMIFNKR